VPRQMDMFPLDGAEADVDAVGKLIAQGRLSSSFRARFIAAVNARS
jgi:hypothetical protein